VYESVNSVLKEVVANYSWISVPLHKLHSLQSRRTWLYYSESVTTVLQHALAGRVRLAGN